MKPHKQIKNDIFKILSPLWNQVKLSYNLGIEDKNLGSRNISDYKENYDAFNIKFLELFYEPNYKNMTSYLTQTSEKYNLIFQEKLEDLINLDLKGKWQEVKPALKKLQECLKHDKPKYIAEYLMAFNSF